MLLGVIVNACAIIVASLMGVRIRRIPERIKLLVMQALSLSVIVMGINMALSSEQFIIVMASLLIGAVIGECMDIDKRLNQVGMWIEARLGKAAQGSFSQGFVSATLIFATGALAILGPLDSGLRGDHQLLFTKSLIDGFSALVFASTLGIGVLFSAIPVFLYQGFIAVFASQIHAWVPPALMETLIAELTSVGGVFIVAIGLNLLHVTKVKVANLLPSLVIVVVIVSAIYGVQVLF
ncbi:DUF554 domain-containing protein [Bacillus sp. FSL W7-1360]